MLTTLLDIIHWPWQVRGFQLFGLLLIAGVTGGILVHRLPYVPRITGFILMGVLLGPAPAGCSPPG